MMTESRFFRIFQALFLSLMLASSLHFMGCSSKKIDENNPQEVYNDAEDDVKDKRYQMALDKMKTVKNKFPYNHLAVQAALRIADIHFLEESYIEAAGAYESFRDLHPKFEKADYVIYQIGESYFLQLPSSDDRDLNPAQKAIDAYNELMKVYPQSQYVGKAREHLKESTERLSAKERYIADFYYKRDMYDSAAKRYEKIIVKYPNTNAEQYAYWRWGQSLIHQSKEAEKPEQREGLLSEAKHVYHVYLSRYPNGEYSKDANRWLEHSRK